VTLCENRQRFINRYARIVCNVLVNSIFLRPREIPAREQRLDCTARTDANINVTPIAPAQYHVVKHQIAHVSPSPSAHQAVPSSVFIVIAYPPFKNRSALAATDAKNTIIGEP
jgi:hypothetical protein